MIRLALSDSSTSQLETSHDVRDAGSSSLVLSLFVCAFWCVCGPRAQAQAAQRTEAWTGVERSLNIRCQEAETKATGAAERERKAQASLVEVRRKLRFKARCCFCFVFHLVLNLVILEVVRGFVWDVRDAPHRLVGERRRRCRAPHQAIVRAPCGAVVTGRAGLDGMFVEGVEGVEGSSWSEHASTIQTPAFLPAVRSM